MGSSSSTQEKFTCDHKKHVKSDANLKSKPAAYSRNAVTVQYDYLHNQVNNPSTSNDGFTFVNHVDPLTKSTSKVSCKPLNDLSKTATSKPSNGLPKSTTYNPNNDLFRTINSKPNTGLPNLNTSNPSNILSKPTTSNSNSAVNTNAKIYNSCEGNKCKKCNSYHTFTELGKLSTHCNVSSQVDRKDTIDQSNFVRDAVFTKEKYNLKSQKIYTESKEPAIVPAAFSLKMLTKDDFMSMWVSWKYEFLRYMKLIDQAENNKKRWGIMLLNRLGPTGQEICKTFTFDDDQANDDIDVLLEKFDYYCMFGDKKKIHGEDIDIYVNNLKTIALKYTTDVDEIVKKKILEEIDVKEFTNSAKTLIPEFSFPSSTKSLTVQEVTYIWMRYENVDFKQTEKISNYTVKNCSKCSLDHPINNCRAYGKQCNKCGNMNHHWSRCPSQYKENCPYCGIGHFFRQCPAYMNECSKCHRLNHFSWMCGLPKVLNCNYCGLTHIASKFACSARNTICVKCGITGHVPAKCRKR